MVLTAGSTDRILGSWGVTPNDPNDLFGFDGTVVSGRTEWLDENDAIARAIVDTIVAGTLGPNGLQYRSAYQEDEDPQLSEAEKGIRRSIRRGIMRGTRAQCFDAGGMLSRRDMSKVTMVSTITNGISPAVYCWKPNRPGRNSHASCWRIVHPTRVSNPNHRPNTDTLRDGYALDEDGSPIGIHVQRSHPASQQVAPKLTWDYFPLYDAEGYRRVTVHSLPRHADQIRPTGWFGPVIQLLRLFGRTLEAKVVADTIKASMGLIVECDNPTAMAAADRNGAVLNGTTKITPGKCYYVKKGTVWSTVNFNYSGQDFDKWQEVVLTNVCAAFGVPFQFVQQKLTNSNMASARVALLQAYRTFHCYQNDLITSTEDPWNQSLIREDLARGRIDGINIADPEQVERLLVGRYLRPARFMPDPVKEAQAASINTKENGVSFDTSYADMGLDTETEWAAREQNDAELKRRGIKLQSANGTPPGAQVPVDAEPAEAPRADESTPTKGPHDA